MVKPPDERKIKKPEACLLHDFQLSGGFLPGVQSTILKLSALDVKTFLRIAAIAGEQAGRSAFSGHSCLFPGNVPARITPQRATRRLINDSSTRFFDHLAGDKEKFFKKC
jgi:hypothetical protein